MESSSIKVIGSESPLVLLSASVGIISSSPGVLIWLVDGSMMWKPVLGKLNGI